MGQLVLTPAEKRVLLFVLLALVVGLGVKVYRDHYPEGSRQDKSTAGHATVVHSGHQGSSHQP